MTYFRMSLWDFYSYTPIEIDYALKAYFEEKALIHKEEWERTRVGIYFNYLFTPTKRRKVTYNTFCKDYLKLNYDDDQDLEKHEISDEEFKNIQDYFKTLPGTNS